MEVEIMNTIYALVAAILWMLAMFLLHLMETKRT